MNPQMIQEKLQDKRILGAVIGVVFIIIVGIIVMVAMPKPAENPSEKELTEAQLKLAQVTSAGKAIEIQALLARQGIQVEQVGGEGGKVDIFFNKGAKMKDRDAALVTLVQSGLMDKNVGLEAFDTGDLTASREEKRIKFFRAQQGELARVIRKIRPIQDASVSLTMPEQTLFRSDEKPMSAAVQVTLDSGERLTGDKVRAITNLLVGSVQGLDATHVAISDTNGNTYSSVLDNGSEMSSKLEEKDEYMKQKVSAQLDKLVGAGNYVVTVSTLLREAPKEMMVQSFDPQGGVVNTKQTFNENLNTGSGPGTGGPASSFLPNGLATATIAGGSAKKDYLRNGVEVNYDNSKTQWIESRPTGMLEDVSIAVTIDSSHFPAMNMEDLKTLIAHAANPTVQPDNVSIARTDLQGQNPLRHSSGDDGEPVQDMSWIYWAGGAVGVLFLIVLLLSMKKDPPAGVSGEEYQMTQRELHQLKEIASQQQMQLQQTQQQTQMLIEAQQRALQSQENMIASQATATVPQQTVAALPLQDTLDELKELVAGEELEDDDLDLQIKSWIESS